MPPTTSLRERARALAATSPGLYDADVLLSWELPEASIHYLHELGQLLRSATLEGCALDVFRSGLAVSIFRDK